MISKPNKYSFAFIAASFLFNETLKIAEIYIQDDNWENIEKKIINENILQKNKEATSKRLFAEIKKRLCSLPESLILDFNKFDIITQNQILFFAISKTYRIIFDFINNVIREKYLLFDSELKESDYIQFWNEIEATHPEAEKLTEKSKNKIKSVIFLILKESGIISKEGIIYSSFPNIDFIKHLPDKDFEYLKIFLLSDGDINKYKEEL